MTFKIMILIPRPLLNEIISQRVLPFIGAGFSLNAKLPRGDTMLLWDQLAEQLAKDLPYNTSTDPLHIALEYEKEYGLSQLVTAVRQLLHIDKASPGKVHEIFARITSFDTVYTTNFDFLLEDAYRMVNRNLSHPETNRRPFKVIIGDKQIPLYAGPNTTNLIKMHGDVDHIEYFVMTKKHYDDYLVKYPMISTHLSSMLITKTALFIGYSLRDLNFRQIRHIIKRRLGPYQRKSYIIVFDANDNELAEYRKEHLYPINLENGNKSKGELLENFLQEIFEYTTMASAKRTMYSTQGESLPDDKLRSVITTNQTFVLESVSDLCYCIIKVTENYDRLFSIGIKPVIEKYGLKVLRANELSSTEGSLMDNIRTAILQSKIVVCDITEKTPNILFELGIALENKKTTILIAQSEKDIPHDILKLPRIIYQNNDEGLSKLQRNLTKEIEKSMPAKAKMLYNLGQYGAAITSAVTYLEMNVFEVLRNAADQMESIGINAMITKVSELKLISKEQEITLKRWITVRNKTVHNSYEPKASESSEIVNGIEDIVDEIKSLDPFVISNWWYALREEERTRLSNLFLNTLNSMTKASDGKDSDGFFKPIDVFKKMELGTYSEELLPMIIRTLEVEGKVKTIHDKKNNLIVSLN